MINLMEYTYPNVLTLDHFHDGFLYSCEIRTNIHKTIYILIINKYDLITENYIDEKRWAFSYGNPKQKCIDKLQEFIDNLEKE
jgi:hypothetical protein